MSQNEVLIKHFKKAKSISQREALVDYSIQSLTKRISELRGMGYNITTMQKRHPVTGQKYARYILKK